MKTEVSCRPIQTGDKIVVKPIFNEAKRIEEFVHIDDTYFSRGEDNKEFLVRMDDYDQPQQAEIVGGRPGEKVILRVRG